MTQTLLSSDKKEIVIGFDSPFCVIGERINPTGRKLLAAEMAAGDYSRVIADAVAQVEAGATMLDVNAGIPMADEPAILAKAIKLVQDVVDGVLEELRDDRDRTFQRDARRRQRGRHRQQARWRRQAGTR